MTQIHKYQQVPAGPLSSPPPPALRPLLTDSNPRPTTIRFSAVRRDSNHKEPTTSYDYSTRSTGDLTIATGCASTRVSLESLIHSLIPRLVSDLLASLQHPGPTAQCLLPQLLSHCQDLILVIEFVHNTHRHSASLIHAVILLSASYFSYFSARPKNVHNRHSCRQTKPQS